MIGLLLPILARWGIPERFQRIVATIGLSLAAAALCALLWAWWLHRHDAKVIAEHEAPIAEAIAEATERANAAAAAEDTARALDNARRDQGLRDAIAEASRSAPVEVSRPAGPAVQAVAKKLRER